MREPLANPLLAVSKKYLNVLSRMVHQLSLDRYHYVLVLIDSHEQLLTQKALAEILNIDKSYMVTILDYLEERDYIHREKNPQDRREQLITLTLKAKEDIPVIRDAIAILNDASLENLSDEQKKTFCEVLHIIEDNLVKIVSGNLKKSYSTYTKTHSII
ncbi:MarR family transcriptional regulator [Daejeonella sp. H1SJ63]|jgi:DNA-binding MarR family transcriptional regulator|uniref:MarR family winged helix-turn-helix transcriptional regulator n=1 Tax=Daejeonella sp. H1SJ63 TaxID=3034145 RepID=UPI0023EE13B0|nr:MarR family transcriptional regulator [Daejeonella sp. H1SJ63]